MAPKVSKRRRSAKGVDAAVLLVVGDLLVTFLWAVVSSLFAEAAETLAQISGLQEFALAVTVTTVSIMLMGPLCDLFGGAVFNPVHNAAFVCAGKGTLKLNTIRMVVQILGALGGSYAAVHAFPDFLTDHFPKLPPALKEGVALEVGVAVEMLLGCIINVVVLYSGDTNNKTAGYWAPIIATVVLIVFGSYYTGPSMNPAIAYSWFHHFQGSSWQQQICVYWLAPFAGAMLGGLLYRWWTGGRSAVTSKPVRQLPQELREAAAAVGKAD